MPGLRAKVNDHEMSLNRLRERCHTIVIDALNFLHDFVCLNGSVASRLKKCKRQVYDFKHIFARHNVRAIWVFDNGQHTEESNQKWVERRLNEVATETRKMIASAETYLMAELLRAGFLVLSPPGIDGDDAVAWIARDTGGHILSRDNDMTRYGLPLDRIFDAMHIVRKNGLANTIVLRQRSASRPVSPRDLPVELFDIKLQEPFDAWVPRTSSFLRNIRSGHLRRGNSDGKTKQWGNLHVLARPLRRNLYHLLRIESMAETMPVWNDQNQEAELEETLVAPSDEYEPELCTSPIKAYQRLCQFTQGSDNDMRRHAMMFIVAEVVDAALPPCKEDTSSVVRIVDIYNQLRTQIRQSPNPRAR